MQRIISHCLDTGIKYKMDKILHEHHEQSVDIHTWTTKDYTERCTDKRRTSNAICSGGHLLVHIGRAANTSVRTVLVIKTPPSRGASPRYNTNLELCFSV